jgi:hypothetical protein
MTTADSPAEPTVNSDLPKTEATPPLRAVHTPNFPVLLRQLGASSLVTTYRAGKLVMVRDEGDHLNTQLTEPERRLQHGLAVQLAPGKEKTPEIRVRWDFQQAAIDEAQALFEPVEAGPRLPLGHLPEGSVVANSLPNCRTPEFSCEAAGLDACCR